MFNEDDVVEVGKVIARISTDASAEVTEIVETPKPQAAEKMSVQAEAPKPAAMPTQTAQVVAPSSSNGTTTRFYSPLVKSIAKQENIGTAELESIQGSGNGGRVTKKDIMHYIENRTAPATNGQSTNAKTSSPTAAISNGKSATPATQGANVEIVEMDRMLSLIHI